jgi:phosphatidylinositol alpha-1,6-mannosyltransferase
VLGVWILCIADVCVRPDLPVSGNVESFGLVALEAAAHALPVVAAALQGIQDAVVPERTGSLLPVGDAERWERLLQICSLIPGVRKPCGLDG